LYPPLRVGDLDRDLLLTDRDLSRRLSSSDEESTSRISRSLALLSFCFDLPRLAGGFLSARLAASMRLCSAIPSPRIELVKSGIAGDSSPVK
jgi:hypothetical protein